jgi:hypothetical protein
MGIFDWFKEIRSMWRNRTWLYAEKIKLIAIAEAEAEAERRKLLGLVDVEVERERKKMEQSFVKEKSASISKKAKSEERPTQSIKSVDNDKLRHQILELLDDEE